PSLMMSKPQLICFSTTSDTARRTRCWKAYSFKGLPVSLAICICFKSGGCGNAPAWVVRIRSVLYFIVPPLNCLNTLNELNVSHGSSRLNCVGYDADDMHPRALLLGLIVCCWHLMRRRRRCLQTWPA